MEIATRRREQEVWQACDDLWALHGELGDLTGDAIRERLIHLGKSRGSPNEIYKYKKTWLSSRGVSQNAQALKNDGDCDPITRAVKLVHEQLKTETNDQIALLKSEFDEAILKKNEELAKAKQALDAVMEEFNAIKSQLAEQVSRTRVLEEERLCEIEIRKISERELLTEKALREKERTGHALLVEEIKKIHAQELSLREEKEQAHLSQAHARIEKLIHEKQQEGFIYSEKLNELKTIIYNQDLVKNDFEKRLLHAEEQRAKIALDLDAKIKQHESLKEESIKLLKNIAAKDAAILHMTQEKITITTERKKLSHALKKANVTIARLRAFRSLT